MINKFLYRLKNKFSNKYYVVYKNSNNRIKTYLIGNIDLYKSFGNKDEKRDNAGFKAYCYARKQVRSFRHDRIVSLTKKWILNFLLEICLVTCIILAILLFFWRKNENKKAFKHESNSSANADSLQSENDFLKNQLSKLQEAFKNEQQLISFQRIEFLKKEELLGNQLKDLEEKLLIETENRKKIVSQKKSSEVRLGNIAETLAPFLNQFDFDPETCTFLGKPIDYISFGEEEITLIEVKSGNSQLNSRQRQIRDQVKNNKVSWKEIRIK